MKKGIVIVLSILLVISIGFCIFFGINYYNSKDTENNDNTTPNTQRNTNNTYRCRETRPDGSWYDYECDEFGRETGQGIVYRHRE